MPERVRAYVFVGPLRQEIVENVAIRETMGNMLMKEAGLSKHINEATACGSLMGPASPPLRCYYQEKGNHPEEEMTPPTPPPTPGIPLVNPPRERTAAVCDIIDALELLLLSVGRSSEGWESQRCCSGSFFFFFGLIVAADGESIHQSSAALHFSVLFRWELYPARSRLNRTLLQHCKFAHCGMNKRLSFLILA